jgi:threonine aldolase
MNVVDLRSDTVTRPTPEMRAAMAEAAVGDDVYGEDPTINALEALAAARVGKEAAVLVPSGTMGNLAAILTHCNRGDEVIVGNGAHTFVFEGGGMASLGGVQPYTIPNEPDGTLPLAAIEAAIRPDDPHYPRTRLITIENTHNRCGGVPLSAAYTQAVSDLARRHGLKLHLDGARLFNAAVALGVPAADLAAPADSVTFCLSKALCAPVGSLLCGSAEFIRQARRARKQLGGGMRQAGVLAAAGIVALNTMVDRLAEDHTRARALAAGLAAVPGLTPENLAPPTNMTFVQVAPEAGLTAAQVAAAVRELGVLVLATGPTRIRLVTHYWVDDAGVEQTVAAFRQALAGARAAEPAQAAAH